MAKKSKNRWPELCGRVAIDDGLPCRQVGAWTEDKLFYWNGYIEITTIAMVGKPQWSGGIVYVDLFAGPGVCKVRESGKRIPGSALLAAWAPKPFSRIIVCEKNPQLAQACEKRLSIVGVANRTEMFVGDCNRIIKQVVTRIPDRALTLAFIDPEGLHIHFETLRKLAENRRVDLAVLFADRMDIVRNVGLYAGQTNSNLDRFLGPESNWRELWNSLSNQDAEHTCQLFGDIFKRQLNRQLGYVEFDDHVFRSPRSALYRVIYASKHKLGATFSKRISSISRSGQRDLPFGD